MSAEDIAAFQQLAETARERCDESLRKWLDLPEIRNALMHDLMIYGSAAFNIKNEGDCLALEIADPFHER